MSENNLRDLNDTRSNHIGDANTNNNKDSYNNNKDSYNTTNNINNNYYEINDINLISPKVNPCQNSNNRTLLKQMVGKRIQLWGYTVNEYNYNNQYIRYTVINIHNKDCYIADHLQLNIPINKYDENIRHNLIWVEGIVMNIIQIIVLNNQYMWIKSILAMQMKLESILTSYEKFQK